MRQVVQGKGILEPGVVPLGHPQTEKSSSRGEGNAHGERAVERGGMVARNGVRAFPPRTANGTSGPNSNPNGKANGTTRDENRNGEGSSSRKERPIQRREASLSPAPIRTKPRRQREESEFEEEMSGRTKHVRRQREESEFEDDVPIRAKQARRRRDESDSEAAEVRTKNPRRPRPREESDASDSAERVRGKERRRVERSPDVSRRRIGAEDEEVIRPRKEASRREKEVSVSPPPRMTQSRRLADETSTQQPRPKAKPRPRVPTPESPRSESPPPRPPTDKRPKPIPKNRKAPPEVQQESSLGRSRPVVERSPSIDQIPDYTEPSPPPVTRVPVASSSTTARDRERPKTNFVAYLNRAKSKKGGGTAASAAPRAVVQGPPPGVNKWRQIVERVEPEPESEEEVDELESEDGYPLQMESEDDAPLQLAEDAPLQLDEDVPLRLDEDVDMDSEHEESDEEPQPRRQEKRQREEAEPRKSSAKSRAEPALRKEKTKTSGKGNAGRARGKNVGAASERSTSSRPASQRLPPPPISSPPLEDTPPPRAGTQSVRVTAKGALPSLKALRLAEKQAEIEKLIDEHDTIVRERYHLWYFKTMIVGFDPVEAKKETSRAWQEVSLCGRYEAVVTDALIVSGAVRPCQQIHHLQSLRRICGSRGRGPFSKDNTP